MSKNPDKLFPLFLVEDLAKTKAFYAQKAGFEVKLDMPNYLQVAYEKGPELCFMTPDGFPDGRARPKFAGEGVIVSIPTTNADDKHAALGKQGVELLNAPADKPWGWRSFLARDPNGVVLDFFHVISDEAR